MATCEGCGAELVEGRSVCAGCGFLNRAAPDPAATPAEPAPLPGPVAAPLGTTGWGTPVAPRPAKRSSRLALVVIVVLVVVAVGATAFLVTRDESGADRASTATCTGTAPKAVAADPAREAYESDLISWTMSGPADHDAVSEPISDGSIARGEVWSVEVPDTNDLHAELALFTEFDEEFNLAETAERTMVNMDSTVVGEAEPAWIGGRCGRVVLGAGSGRAGDGWARLGFVRAGGNKVFVRGYLWISDDRTEGDEGFADLVDSVRIRE